MDQQQVNLKKAITIHLVFVLLYSLLYACTNVEPEVPQSNVTAGTNTPMMPNLGGQYQAGSNNPWGSQQNNNSDSRPDLMRIGDKVAAVGQELKIQLSATDPKGLPLTYGIRSALPNGAKFDKDIGLFTWTPTAADVGARQLVTFEVSNGMLKDQESIYITVNNGISDNLPPLIEPVGDLLISVGTNWSYQVVVTDPNGDILNYQLSGVIPEGLMIDPIGLLSWTPTAEEIGNHEIIIQISDGLNQVELPMKLIVRDGNQADGSNTPPSFNPMDSQIAVLGQSLSFTISAQDNDPSTLSYKLSNRSSVLPAGAEFDTSSATFSWTPTPDQAGQSVAIIFEVSDGEFRDFLRVQIDVQGGNASPDQCMNDNYSTQTQTLNPPEQINGMLCAQQEADYFLVSLQERGSLLISLSFMHAMGDVDLYLYAEQDTNTILYDSATSADIEEIQTLILEPNNYLIQVYLYNEGQVSYELNVSLNTENSCQYDQAEGDLGNQTKDTASLLSSGNGQQFNLCPGDVDFYRFDLTANQMISIEMQIQSDQPNIDIDIDLLDNNGTIVESSNTVNPTEIIRYSPLSTGSYFLKVYPYSHLEQAVDYLLNVTQSDAGNGGNQQNTPMPYLDPNCNADRLEPNNSFNRVSGLNPQLYGNLTECGDGDWFRSNIAGNANFVFYLSSNAPLTVKFYDQSQTELMPNSEQNQFLVGCNPNYQYCVRYQLNGYMGLIYYFIQNQGTSSGYEMRIREGDEVGGACYDDFDCNIQYQCLQLSDESSKLCTKPCSRNADCPSNSACVYSVNQSNDYCLASCDAPFQCQNGVSCLSQSDFDLNNVLVCQ